MAPSSRSPAKSPAAAPPPAAAWRAFRRGLTNAGPFSLVIIPFALLFGVVATSSDAERQHWLADTAAQAARAVELAAQS